MANRKQIQEAIDLSANLEIVKDYVERIPELGQALAGDSVPVILPVEESLSYYDDGTGKLKTTATFEGELGEVSLTAEGGLNALEGIETDTGNIATSVGNIDTDTGNMAAYLGNIDSDTGNILTYIGTIDTDTGNIATSTGNMDTSLNNIETNTGNMDTSLNNIETSTGNMDTSLNNIETYTGRIPAQGQALAAASMPVVLTADQISTLTPSPAAITISEMGKETFGAEATTITESGTYLSVSNNSSTNVLTFKLDTSSWTATVEPAQSFEGSFPAFDSIDFTGTAGQTFSYAIGDY